METNPHLSSSPPNRDPVASLSAAIDGDPFFYHPYSLLPSLWPATLCQTRQGGEGGERRGGKSGLAPHPVSIPCTFLDKVESLVLRSGERRHKMAAFYHRTESEPPASHFWCWNVSHSHLDKGIVGVKTVSCCFPYFFLFYKKDVEA